MSNLNQQHSPFVKASPRLLNRLKRYYRQLEGADPNHQALVRVLHLQDHLGNTREVLNVGRRFLEPSFGHRTEPGIHKSVLIYFNGLFESHLTDEMHRLARRICQEIGEHHPLYLYFQASLAYVEGRPANSSHLLDTALAHHSSESTEIHVHHLTRWYRILRPDVAVLQILLLLKNRKMEKAQEVLQAAVNSCRFTKTHARRLLMVIAAEPEYRTAMGSILKRLWLRFPEIGFVEWTLTLTDPQDLSDELQELLLQLAATQWQDSQTFVAGRIFFSTGNYSHAIRFLQKIDEQSRDWSKARYLLAQCHLELGNFEQAVSVLKELLRKNPDHEVARRLYEALQGGLAEVQSVHESSRKSFEAEVCQALAMCERLFQRTQYEVSLLVLGQVFGLFFPDEPAQFGSINEVLQAAIRIKNEALRQEYPRIVDHIDRLIASISSAKELILN